MATQKERRATPRKPPAEKAQPVAKTPTPQAELPKGRKEARAAPAEQPSPEDIRRRIEMSAYFKAKERGFAPGYELEDWLAAEREVKQHLQP